MASPSSCPFRPLPSSSPTEARTWIVDITHYEDILDPTLDVPGPARRLGAFFGTIVAAATAWPFPDQPRTTGVRCRRRPNRKPCPGLLSNGLSPGEHEMPSPTITRVAQSIPIIS